MKATEKQKEYSKNYYQKNKEKQKEYNQERRKKYFNNPELYKKKSAEYRKAHPEKVRAYMKYYWIKNKDRLNVTNRQRWKEWYYANKNNSEYRNHKRIWAKNRMNNNIQFAIKKRLRLRVWQAVNDIRKETYDSEFHLNYKPITDKLLSELPNDFKEKHSKYQIDHIIALYKFDLTKQEELEKAFAPRNHQWLTLEEHKIKTKKERAELKI